MADSAHITRRNAFKAIAALPVFVGALATAKFGLAALLDDFEKAKAAHQAAEAIVEKCSAKPGCPDWAQILFDDFSMAFRR